MDLTIEPEKTSSKGLTEYGPATPWEIWYILKNNNKCPDCESEGHPGELVQWPSHTNYKCTWCGARFNVVLDNKLDRIPTNKQKQQ